MSSGLTTGQKKRKNAQHIAPFPPSYLRCKLNCLSKRQNKSDIGWQQRQKNRHSHDTANIFLFPLLSNSYFKVHMFHLAPEKKKKKNQSQMLPSHTSSCYAASDKSLCKSARDLFPILSPTPESSHHRQFNFACTATVSATIRAPLKGVDRAWAAEKKLGSQHVAQTFGKRSRGCRIKQRRSQMRLSTVGSLSFRRNFLLPNALCRRLLSMAAAVCTNRIKLLSS